MGPNGLKALLNQAKMQHLIGNFPPGNLHKQFDFADFAQLNGPWRRCTAPGGRAMALRAGRKAFDQGLKNFGAMVGIADRTFRLLPLGIRMKVGLRAMATAFSSTAIRSATSARRRITFCMSSSAARCVGAGMLTRRYVTRPRYHPRWVGLGTSGKKFKLTEVACIAKGDPSCDFVISKEPIE